LGTELLPAISLSWEPAELNIMTTPPRKQVIPSEDIMTVSAEEAIELARVPSFIIEKVEVPSPPQKKGWECWKDDDEDDNRGRRKRKDKGENLVDVNSLSWSYLQAGIIESVAAFYAFFLVFSDSGIPFINMWGLARNGQPYSSNPPTPLILNGVVFDSDTLNNLLNESNSAYFLTIVIVQWFTLYVSKVRYEYPYGKRMFENWRTYAAIVPAFLYAIMLTYTPGVTTVLSSHPVRAIAYIPAFVGGTTLVLYEFIRKYVIRKYGLDKKATMKKNEREESGDGHQLRRSLSIDKGYKSPRAGTTPKLDAPDAKEIDDVKAPKNDNLIVE